MKQRELEKLSSAAKRLGYTANISVIRLAKEKGIRLYPVRPGAKRQTWLIESRAIDRILKEREA